MRPSPRASVGRVVSGIDATLGLALLVGLDQVALCGCPKRELPRPVPCPWQYQELGGADLRHYGSLPVVVLNLTGRSDPLPVLVLERDQIGAALDGLVALRRLISLAGAPASSCQPEAAARAASPAPATVVR